MEENNKYYHVYNRGVDKKSVFSDKEDYNRFLVSLIVLNTTKPVGGIFQFNKRNKINTIDLLGRHSMSTNPEDRLVEILSYSLLPNHFHLILKEKVEKGVSSYMRKLSNAYTKFYNFKYKRSGFLFQGRYKKVEINSDNQLKYLFGYVNGNYEIHAKTSDVFGRHPMSTNRSSYNELFGSMKILTDRNYFSEEFKSNKDFDSFLKEVIKESSDIKKDRKKYIIE